MFLSNHSFTQKMFMKHVREAIPLQVWDTDISYKIFYDVPPVPWTGFGASSFLGILNIFLPLSRKLFSHVPIWLVLFTQNSTKCHILRDAFPDHVPKKAVPSSHSLYPHPALFCFTALITTCHVFICYVFLFPSLEWMSMRAGSLLCSL